MNKYLKLLIISVIILYILMDVYYFCFLSLVIGRTPSYSYGVSMSTDKTLTNVTLIIPLPTEEGKIIDISKISTSESTNWEKYHDWFNPSGWKGWNVTITDTLYGPMMKLTKDTVTTDMQAYKYGIDNILYMTKDVDYSIDGYDPFQNDILMRPRENHENPIVYQEKLQQVYDIPFSTYAYISYDNYSEINASVSLGLKLVVNTGMIEHESRYKWKWYTGIYSEYPRGSLNPGWNTLNGTTHVSTGSWRSVPAWVEIFFPSIEQLGRMTEFYKAYLNELIRRK